MQTATIVIKVRGPKATAITFVPTADEFESPVIKGTVVGSLTIEPTGWTGDISISGPDAALFIPDIDLKISTATNLVDIRSYEFVVAVD